MRIAVAGGTGTVGSLVVERLRDDAHTVVSLTRADGVDVASGEGLDAALTGCEAVVDALGTATTGRRAASRFFGATTAALLTAGSRAGVAHHVALSIVGIDGAAYGYYRGKLMQESVLTSSSGPWSLLRATQLHEFAGQLLDRSSVGGVGVVPAMRVRPVAAAAVAERLARIATGPPLGRATDLAGPAEEDLVAMARAVAARHGVRRVVGLRVPGAAGRQMRDGTLLPGADAELAGPSFADWLGG